MGCSSWDLSYEQGEPECMNTHIREKGHTSMSTETNKAIVVQLYEEIFNKGDLDLADKLVAPNVVIHDPQIPSGAPDGPQGLKFAVTMLRTAFPDNHHTIEDLVAEGDKVVVRLTHTGYPPGDLFRSYADWQSHRYDLDPHLSLRRRSACGRLDQP
jgi:predicted SnoaL-like aldol condensation-catalyzing enzyme